MIFIYRSSTTICNERQWIIVCDYHSARIKRCLVIAVLLLSVRYPVRKQARHRLMIMLYAVYYDMSKECIRKAIALPNSSHAQPRHQKKT